MQKKERKKSKCRRKKERKNNGEVFKPKKTTK